MALFVLVVLVGVSRLRLGESRGERDRESLSMTNVSRRIPRLRIASDAIVTLAQPLARCVQNDCGVTFC